MTGRRIAAVAAVIFGVLTIVSGGTALRGAIDMGAVVPFVLWFNFLAGFAYVVCGLLLWIGHRLAFPLALLILAGTAAIFAAFGWRVLSGGAYEMRTVGAMTLRTAFWVGMAVVAWRDRDRITRPT
jgi:hypothetical protein